MIDRAICPRAQNVATHRRRGAARPRNSGQSWPRGPRSRGLARARADSRAHPRHDTRWSPRPPWAIATRRSNVYYSRCNYTFSGCWQSTIPCLSLTFHLPGRECKSGGGGTSRALLLLGVRAEVAANKTIARDWCRGMPPSVVEYRSR